MTSSTVESESTQDTLRTSAEVAQQFTESLPGILQSVQEFQPQFTQAALQEFQQFAPQFAQVQQDVLEQFSPQQAALGELLAGQAAQRSTEGLTADELSLFENKFKALSGGQSTAPIGAADISRALVEQQIGAKQQGQQLGLQLSGQVPITQASFQPSTFNVGSAFSPVFSSQVFGQTGTQTQTSTPSTLNTVGQISGGLGGAFSGLSSLSAAGGLGNVLGTAF